MGPMNLPWDTWAVYPFTLLSAIIVIVWGYLLNKKMGKDKDGEK